MTRSDETNSKVAICNSYVGDSKVRGRSDLGGSKVKDRSYLGKSKV